MAAEHEALNGAVQLIAERLSSTTTKVDYSAMLHTADIDYSLEWLDSIEVIRDYNNSIGDNGIINFKLYTGDYMEYFHNNRHNMEITIRYTDQETSGATSDRYKFIITNNITGIEGSHITNVDYAKLNETEMINIEGQFISTTLEALRSKTIDKIYQGDTAERIIKSAFAVESAKMSTGGSDLALTVDMITADIQKPISRLVVPTGTMLFDLPVLLQDVKYGVYNTGLGLYLQKYTTTINPPRFNQEPVNQEVVTNDTIFVYPLFDTARAEEATKKLIIYNTQIHKFNQVDHTYFEDADVVNLFTTSDTKFTDNGEIDFMNHGNTLVVSETNQLIQKGVQVDDETITMSAGNNVSSRQSYARADGGMMPKFLKDNESLSKAKSLIAKQNTTTLMAQWNFCNPRLIFPGMAVTYVYVTSEGTILRLNGSVAGFYYKYQAGTSVQHGMLTLTLEKPIDALARAGE